MARLALLIILFLTSLLSILPAPLYYLWLLAIAVTEYPLVLALITGIVLLTGFWFKEHQIAALILGMAAMLLFLSPIIRAYTIGGNLKEELESAFGNEEISIPPFKLATLFKRAKSISSKTVVYKELENTALSLDFFPSKIGGNRPCVVVIHGGSWSSGDSKQLPELNSYLADIGYHVAAINYRLAPKYQNPLPVEDVKDALNFLRGKAGEWQIDTSNFVLLGRSAGAQIALLAAYTLKDVSIKGVIDFYGPADMVWGYSLPANPLIMDSRLVMENYLGGKYETIPLNYEKSSPILFVNQQSPATLIIHGKNDVLVAYEHSLRLNKKLEDNHIKHYLLSLPWATHGFDFNINGPGGQLSTYAVRHFLESVFKE